jgi:peptidoglycan hydrolase-like protein with peptidoglycan-binding domain
MVTRWWSADPFAAFGAQPFFDPFGAGFLSSPAGMSPDAQAIADFFSLVAASNFMPSLFTPALGSPLPELDPATKQLLEGELRQRLQLLNQTAPTPNAQAAMTNGALGPAALAGPSPSGGGSQSQALAQAAERVAAEMNVPGLCYRGVKAAVRQTLGVELTGGSAYMAADQLASNPKFKEISVSRDQLANLPAGAIVVWSPYEGNPHGHISVALGDGREAASKIRNQFTSLGNGSSTYRVFVLADEAGAQQPTSSAPPSTQSPAPSSELGTFSRSEPAGWLQRPMRGPKIKALQRMLKRLGLYKGPIDGYFGPVTERAVKAFQRSRGAFVDGRVGPQTAGLLQGGGTNSAPQSSSGSAPTSSGAAPAASGPTAPQSESVPPTIDGMLSWAKSMIGSPYAAVNPFRFGDVPWDGQPHQSVNGSGRTYNFPAGTRVFDCSGFVVGAFRQIGVDLAKYGATTSSSIASSPHLQNISREELRPGDLITYTPKNGIGHVVIYLGNGQTIEASGGKGVNIGTVDWGRAATFKRVPLPG